MMARPGGLSRSPSLSRQSSFSRQSSSAGPSRQGSGQSLLGKSSDDDDGAHMTLSRKSSFSRAGSDKSLGSGSGTARSLKSNKSGVSGSTSHRSAESTGGTDRDARAAEKLHGKQLPVFGFGSARYGMLGQLDFSALPCQDGDLFERYTEDMVFIDGYLGDEVTDLVAGEHHFMFLVDWKAKEGGTVCCHGLASLGRLGVGSQRRARTKGELRAERKRNKRLKEAELLKIRAKEREKEKDIPDFSGLPFEIAHLPNGSRVGDDKARFVFLPMRIRAGYASQVSAGQAHSACATEDGQLFVWGCARHGRLGIPPTPGMPFDLDDGHDTYYPNPMTVDFPGAKVKYVACGLKHTLACDDKGAIFAWGLGRYGRLGFGDEEMKALPLEEPDVEGEWDEFSWHQPKPRQITSLQGINIIRVYAGAYNSFCLSGGSGTPQAVYAWGLARYGLLGIGEYPSICCHERRFDADIPAAKCVECVKRLAPPKEGGIPTFIEERRGHPAFSRCNVAFPREVSKNHDFPADAEDPLDVYSATPCEVQALAAQSIANIIPGTFHHLALSSAGKLLAWGLLRHGRCGIGKFDPEGAMDPKTGTRRHDKTVPTYPKEKGYEVSNRGQIKIVEDDPASWYLGTPTVLQGFKGVRVLKAAAGECHSAAITEDNKLFTWGVARHGRLGTKDDPSTLLSDPTDEEGMYRPDPKEVAVATETLPKLVACTSTATMFVASQMTATWQLRHQPPSKGKSMREMGASMYGMAAGRSIPPSRKGAEETGRGARRISLTSGWNTVRTGMSDNTFGEEGGEGGMTSRSHLSQGGGSGEEGGGTSRTDLTSHNKNEGGVLMKVPQEQGVSSGLKAGFKAIGGRLTQGKERTSSASSAKGMERTSSASSAKGKEKAKETPGLERGKSKQLSRGNSNVSGISDTSDETGAQGAKQNVVMHGLNHFASGASKGMVQLVRGDSYKEKSGEADMDGGRSSSGMCSLM